MLRHLKATFLEDGLIGEESLVVGSFHLCMPLSGFIRNIFVTVIITKFNAAPLIRTIILSVFFNTLLRNRLKRRLTQCSTNRRRNLFTTREK